MSYAIVSDPPITSTPLRYYIRQPFDVSFGSTFTLYPSSIQFTDSASILLSNAIGNQFASVVGFTTKGNLGNLVVDAISFISPIASTIVPKIQTNSAYSGITVTASGVIYFADTNNNKIYRCDTNGVYTLYAGTGVSGITNGFRTSATFAYPIGLAVDSVGNVYVSEQFDIRKIDLAGNVTTVAGSASQGAADGIGSAARFMFPAAMTIDPNNDNVLYVVDSDAHSIRRIDLTTSNVTTYAGTLNVAGFINGPVATAKFTYPRQAVIQKSSGNMFIADSYNHVVRRIQAGTVSTYAGNGSNNPTNDGTLTTGSFSFPEAITYDVSSDSLYVFQTNQTIKKVTSTTISKYIGIPGVFGSTNGDSTAATFNQISELVAYNSSLYACEIAGNIRRIDIPATVSDARPSGTRPSGYTIVATRTIPVESLSRIDASTTAVGGTIQLSTYIPFAGNIYKSVAGDSLQYTSSTSELISFLSNIDTSTVSFSSAAGFRQSYSYPLTVVVDAISNSSIVDTLSNTVIVNAAGFDTNGISNFTFYKNQPIGNYSFAAPIPIQQPIVSPSLPAGLSLVQQDVAGLLFYLTGTPIVQLPTSNYRIIGKGRIDTAKVITTTVSIRVLGEQVLLDIAGSSNVQIVTNTTIADRIITAAAPPYPLSGNRIRYSWSPALPDGLVFKDINGTSQNTAFAASDASSTIILTGTPTANAAINATSSNITTTLTAARLTTPIISNTLTLNFQFSEQVLFRTPNIQSDFYRGVRIPANQFSNSFSAYTKFADALINSIYSPDLRSDLSLSFVFSNQRADLSGVPISTGSGTFTVIARNTNNISASYIANYSIINDTITFQSPTPTVDTCLNYIISRSPATPKDGYYTYPVQFKASAASGCNIVLSTNDLSGTGLSLSNVGNNTYQISGIPVSTKPLTTMTIDASSLVTTAITSTSLKYAILPDQFYFTDASFTFIQNRQITPYQFNVSTLSERNVVGFAATGLPTGISLSAVGRLTGMPVSNASGSFNLIPSTGYASGLKAYSYTIIPDSIILTTSPLSYKYAPSSVVNIQITGLSFSGRTVSNYSLCNFTPSYGLSIGSSTGTITGTLSNTLPASCNFYVSAKSGLIDGSLNALLTSTGSQATISFDGLPTSTVAFIAPTQTSYIFYQYMQITPITFNATGVGQIYYFVATNDLPLGLSFDPNTDTITGTPMRLGENSITIYAKDDTGVTKLVLSTNTIIPLIVKNQTSAGAYTSLIRQYTEVNAAQNARDRRVLPTENINLGEFQSPYKPNAVTPDVCPKC